MANDKVFSKENKMEKFNIYAFADEADKSIDGQINAMLRNNLKGLEIRGVDGENISDISLDKAKEVKEKLDANGLITWSIGSPIGKINITDDFAPHLDKFKHTLEIANILGSKNIRLFSFYIPKNADIYKNEVLDRMGKFLEVAKNTGINLCHENEKGIFGDTPERCLELFKALPDLKGIFDPANFVQCGVDTLKAWKLLKGNTYYMHIKDAKKDGFVVPSGFGDGNVKEIVENYIARGRKNLTMEPHLAVFDGLKNLEKEGDTSAIGEFEYESNEIAFDTACNTFKKLLGEL